MIDQHITTSNAKLCIYYFIKTDHSYTSTPTAKVLLSLLSAKITKYSVRQHFSVCVLSPRKSFDSVMITKVVSFSNSVWVHKYTYRAG